MGAIGGLIGTAGGASGSGFSGPAPVDITSPVTPDQIAGAQSGVGQALGNSNALLNALQGVNGIGNQQMALGAGSNIYNSLAGLNGTGAMGSAMGQQGGLNTALNNANGVGMQVGGAQGLQNVLAQQQATAGQLQGIANGTGPNPAQAMLNNATGANVANQAAMMAGQRGAGANVGLMARQAAQQGASTQQQAAGQAALMQAQQQLAAINAQGAQQAGMANTNQAIAGVGSGLTGQQQGAINQQFGQGNAAMGNMKDVAGMNAAIAQNQIANQIGVNNNNIQGNLSNAGQNIGAAGQYNATQAGQQANINSANAGLAGNAMTGQRDIVGGAIKGVGGGLYSMANPAAAAGGADGPAEAITGGGSAASMNPASMASVASLAGGGEVHPAMMAPQVLPPNAPSSSFGQFLHGYARPAQMQAYGGQLDQSGGAVMAANPAQKAIKKGDSYANDKVNTVLSEDEIVLPRSVTMSKDPVRSSADFVRKVIAKRRAGK